VSMLMSFYVCECLFNSIYIVLVLVMIHKAGKCYVYFLDDAM